MKYCFLNFHDLVSGDCQRHSDVDAKLFGRICQNTRNFQHPVAMLRLQTTFDDGWESHVREALPTLLRTQQTGIFFIITSQVGQKGFMGWRDVQELSRCGMEIGSHSHTHPENLCRLSAEKIREEFRISKEILENKIGQSVTSFSAPHGYWNHRVFQLSRESNYQKFFTSEPGYHSGVETQSPMGRFSAHRRVSLEEIDRILGGSITLLVRLKIRYFLLGWLKKAVSEKTFQAIRGKLCP